MLSSSIVAPADFRMRSAASARSPVLRGSDGSVEARRMYPHARGPLAQRALRLLGIGGTGQAWSSWADPALQRAFRTEGGSAGLANTWLAARTMPTPHGYLRAPMS